MPYILSKPGKFEIEVYWAVDADKFPSSLLGLHCIGENTLTQEGKDVSSSIPDAVVCNVSKPFLFKGATLCSLWDMGSKPVLVISSQHGYQENRSDIKPDIVAFHSSTKAGVDNVDTLNRTYSSKRKCR